MSIELRNVTKRVRLGHIRTTYENLNIRLDEGSRVAFLGHKEAGLPAIVNLICAADAPDSGHILRTRSISFPIPTSTYVQKHLSLAANARFIARLYETDERDFLARVVEMGGLEKFIDLRSDKCPSEARSLFCFAVGVCLPFEHYILTNTNIGKKTERDRIDGIIDEVRQRAGLLLVTSSIKSAQQFCDQAYVFDEGSVTFYDDMEAAAERFKAIVSKGDIEDYGEEEETDSVLEDMVNTDF